MMDFEVHITWRFDIFWKHNGAIKSKFFDGGNKTFGFLRLTLVIIKLLRGSKKSQLYIS